MIAALNDPFMIHAGFMFAFFMHGLAIGILLGWQFPRRPQNNANSQPR